MQIKHSILREVLQLNLFNKRKAVSGADAPTAKKGRRRSVLFYIMGAAFSAFFIFSAIKVTGIVSTYKKHDAVYDNLSNKYVSAAPAASAEKPALSAAASSAPSAAEETAPAPEASEEESRWLQPVNEVPPVMVDIDAVIAENPDTVGWLYAPDTRISYPVVKGNENEYYLYRTFERVYDGFGTIYFDYRCSRDLSDPSCVIYGHNMQNGSMFADLMKYEDPEWYKEHPALWFFTKDTTYKLVPLCGYTTWDEDIIYCGPLTLEQRDEWLDNAVKHSTFKLEDESIVKKAEHVFLMSTCTNRNYLEKFVLAAALVPVVNG